MYTRTHSPAHSPTLAHTLTPIRSFTHSLALALILPHSHSHTHPLTHLHSHSHSHYTALMKTHLLTRSHTSTHQARLGVSVPIRWRRSRHTQRCLWENKSQFVALFLIGPNRSCCCCCVRRKQDPCPLPPRKPRHMRGCGRSWNATRRNGELSTEATLLPWPAGATSTSA